MFDNVDLRFENKDYLIKIRGSVPGHWTQDLSSMVPKPQIFFQLSDPYCRTAAKHFDGLLQKYGAPIIVLNLVSIITLTCFHKRQVLFEFKKAFLTSFEVLFVGKKT